MLSLAAPHGGGHHGGGHHGGGHPRHGGGRRGRWGRGGWQDYSIIGACPDVYAPVLGTDGVVYQNACLADMAGVGVVKTIAGLSCIGCMAPVPLGDTTPNAWGAG